MQISSGSRSKRLLTIFSELQKEVEINADVLYRMPVINIKGSSHAQFASGPMPEEVRKYDLVPEISDVCAHEEMGLHMANFVTVSLNVGNVTSAKLNISQAYVDSGDRFGVSRSTCTGCFDTLALPSTAKLGIVTYQL